MKELSIMEMDYVSGAADTPGWGTGYIWDFSSAQSAITSLANNLFQAGAGLIGMATGAAIGGNTGGNLGFGLIGALGGAIVGGIAGLVGGLTAGLFGGFDTVFQIAEDVLYAAFNGTFVLW
ncbi:MAG: hypothetical protein E7D25_22710 [Klebsiella sp.]|uniref:hypothetical protein n=1 Tax=Klebsiella sp. TaxID=576 RepID=UPI002902C010|nr:hypothetical protein [Klebsiella sp.]MDU2513375.1 hypothetical protein [Klebsiella sp.]